VAALNKMTVFWDIAPFSLVETDQHFRSAYYSETCEFQPNLVVQYPRRQSSSDF
jgi:hypothetical protein